MEPLLLRKTIKSINKGKKNAFKIIIDVYGKKLFGYIYSLTTDKYLSEDIYQEVLFKIFKQINMYDFSSPFENWIIVIARNHTYDQLKKKQKVVYPFSEEIFDVHDEADPESIVIKKENFMQLDHLIDTLSIKHQEVIRLKYFGQYSYKEISNHLNVEEKKVKWLLYDARQSLAILCRKENLNVL